MNPNTRTCPIFRSRRDAVITRGIYERVPVLIRRERRGERQPWGVSFLSMFHMSNDSGLFQAAPGPGLLTLYEAKMIHQFDHGWATYEGRSTRDTSLPEKQDLDHTVTPRYWVLECRRGERGWVGATEILLRDRGIAPSTNERTLIASLMPLSGVGNSIVLWLIQDRALVAALIASINSFTFDFVARQKVGGSNINMFYLKQFPVIPPGVYRGALVWTGRDALSLWIVPPCA